MVKHFIHHSNSSAANPSLLIFDNHESHICVNVRNLEKDNGVTILTLPPHTSNKFQPLDVAIYYAFTNYYNKAVDSWMLHHPSRLLTIYDVAGCVGYALTRTMTPVNII